MSLLLDAMKKTGDKATGLPTDNLTVDEYTHTHRNVQTASNLARREKIYSLQKRRKRRLDFAGRWVSFPPRSSSARPSVACMVFTFGANSIHLRHLHR
jgi:hypothetical protein